MSSAARLGNGLWTQATIGGAAALRDLFRTAQFYSRDMANADGGLLTDQKRPSLPSRIVANLARQTDKVMTWAANFSITLFQPGWRKLPSPFAPGMADAVGAAIRDGHLLHYPIFNAYFFRAARHIAAHYAEAPCLVLEHRVDLARRTLTAPEGRIVDARFMASVLLALVSTKPVARLGRLKNGAGDFNVDPNIVIFAIAVLALLLAEEGRPVAMAGEEDFYFIVGALLKPRLSALSHAIRHQDLDAVTREIMGIRSLY